jgi:hypothetical protein
MKPKNKTKVLSLFDAYLSETKKINQKIFLLFKLNILYNLLIFIYRFNRRGFPKRCSRAFA